jgi:tryptophan-rich sensory protein
MFIVSMNKWAGIAMVPFAVWTGFYAILTFGIKKENPAGARH